GAILRDNYYGWFDRVGRGVYTLSEKGAEEIEFDEYKSLVVYYSG
ncbi:MAG: hypothetical protein GX193_05505, partial [Clostridiales bacterium]|nr:hypothetical protein [Clostridiales bacterium]